MSIKSPTSQPAGPAGPLSDADVTVVLECLVSGKPVDPAVAERVHAHAEQVTAGIRRDHGLVDDEAFQSLLDDEV
jgi:hypothetical protein